MNNTFEERSMVFMNCPWKSTAECNFICVDCLRSDPDGFRALLDDFNRLGERLKTKEDENG